MYVHYRLLLMGDMASPWLCCLMATGTKDCHYRNISNCFPCVMICVGLLDSCYYMTYLLYDNRELYIVCFLLNSVVEILEKHGLQKPISYVKNSQTSEEEAHQLMVKLCRHTGRKYERRKTLTNRNICQHPFNILNINVCVCMCAETLQWVRRCGQVYCGTCWTCRRMSTPVWNQRRVTR